MWHRLTVPPICELIGFSVPDDGEMLVVSYEGVHLVRLDGMSVETDASVKEYDVYDPGTGLARFRGRDHEIVGLHGGRPLVESSRAERVELDVVANRLTLRRGGEVSFSMEYGNSSGDWAVATFSRDGRYLVLGCPCDFDLVVLDRREATPTSNS